MAPTLLADADIRPALKSLLQEEHKADTDTVYIEELGVCRGQVRVDMAVVNGVLHGVEIKSDRDSLRRLTGQADFYSKVFEKITLVVGERHLKEVLEMVPGWWGIRVVESTEQGPRFRSIRSEARNLGVEARFLVEMLWLDEAIALLAQHGIARGVKGKPRHVVWDRVCEHLSTQEIAAAVRDRLKARAASHS